MAEHKNANQEVDPRKLDTTHVLFASFLGANADFGLFSQGSAQLVMPRVARYVMGYFQKKEKLPDFRSDPLKNLKIVVDFLQQEIGLAEELGFSADGQTLWIRSNTCKLCPKGVGGAEIKSTACPYPHFILEAVNMVSPQQKLALDTPNHRLITKADNNCLIGFKVIEEELTFPPLKEP
jgi:hypothetical protein